MNGKTISKAAVGEVWKAVASGEAEIGIGFMPNVLSTQGVQAARYFPSKLQFYTGIAAGIGANARQADAAKAFRQILARCAGNADFLGKGFRRVKKAAHIAAAQR